MPVRTLQTIVIVGLAGIAAIAPASAQQKTLDIVKARGVFHCGVHTGVPGYAQPDDKGNWTGFNIDYCRAIAAATLGDAAKVKFIPATPKERFTMLQAGETDALIRTTTWTLSRDSSLGLSFAGIDYFDGQGFMVKKARGVKSARELDGATICVQTGTTTELNLADYFKTNTMKYTPVVFDRADEVLKAYDAGRCDAYTNDAAGLAAYRIALPVPDDHVVLGDLISKEPLGPAVRQGDMQWFTIVKWVHFARLNAEELGVTRANVDSMRATSTNPEIKRLLGTEGDFGKGLGLDNDWAYRVIKSVGNYGESFDQHLGDGSRLKMARGLNKLWRDGGLQYAPPIR
jgi:general L-amino acid transport system substrate-binding protein